MDEESKTIKSGVTSYTADDIGKSFDVVVSQKDKNGNEGTCTLKITVADNMVSMMIKRTCNTRFVDVR